MLTPSALQEPRVGAVSKWDERLFTVRARRVYLIILGSGIGNLSGILAMFVLARYYGPDVLGVIAFWLSFVTTIGFPLALDLETAHLKIVSARSSVTDQRRAIGAYSVLKSAAIAASIVVLCIAFVVREMLTADDEELSSSLFVVFVFYLSITAAGSILVTTFAAYGHTARQQVSQTVGALTRNFCLVAVALLGGGILLLGFSYVLGAVVTVGMGLLLFFRRYSIAMPKSKDLLEYAAVSGPLMTAPIFTLAILNIDRLTLDHFWGTSVLGVYFLAQSLAVSLLLIGRAVRLVLIPSFTQDFKMGRMDRIGNHSRNTARYLSVLFIPSIAFMLLWSEPYVIFVFGESFKEAGMILSIILIGIWSLLLCDPLASFTVAKGNRWAILVASVTGFAVVILGLVLLVPESLAGVPLMGLAGIGASIAFSLSCFAQLAYYYRHSPEIRPYLEWRLLVKLAGASVVGLVSCIAVALLFDGLGHDTIGLIVMPVVFGVVFLFAARVTGGLTSSDLSYLKEVLSLRKMAGYIANEIAKTE